MNTNTINPLSWEALEFEGNSTSVKSIKRLSDGTIFSLGDYVTNGTQMKGNIEKFEFSFKSNDVYVYTDWSGVGMNLDSLKHSQPLPCEFQIGKTVFLNVGDTSFLASIRTVHFSTGKVKYDLDVRIDKKETSRFYNIDEDLITKEKTK